MAVPSLTDLKAHLGITNSVDDDELVDFLDAAVEVVESIAGPISDGTVTEIHRGVSSNVLVLRRVPAVALTEVAIRYGLTSTAQNLEDYELDAETGVVYGSGFYGDYAVTYTTGRSALPASIRLAVLIIAEHLYETQRMPGQTSDLPAGFGGMDGVPDIRAPRGFAIPSRAQELLQPYMNPVIA